MEFGEGKMEPGVAIELSEAQKQARKKRNLAIGGCLLGLVVIFYVATVAKFVPSAMQPVQEQEQSQ